MNSQPWYPFPFNFQCYPPWGAQGVSSNVLFWALASFNGESIHLICGNYFENWNWYEVKNILWQFFLAIFCKNHFSGTKKYSPPMRILYYPSLTHPPRFHLPENRKEGPSLRIHISQMQCSYWTLDQKYHARLKGLFLATWKLKKKLAPTLLKAINIHSFVLCLSKRAPLTSLVNSYFCFHY